MENKHTTAAANFVTGLRAASFAEALKAAGIDSTVIQPRWTNKKLPPPRLNVMVAEADFDRATEILADFLRGAR